MIIRDEALSDTAMIRAVVAAAFRRLDEADLVERLRADGDAIISLVALDAGSIVGHIPFPK